jgi:DASH complex subunit ASK1
MANQPHNPLLHPPFYLIQGINPNSSVSTQTEQIDQLNTLLLQEIDANFAKFHQIVTTRVLPEIKRFSLAGEPTKEAANVSTWYRCILRSCSYKQFWRKFYEAAYGVRSTVEGESTVHDQSDSHSTYEDHTSPIARDEDQTFSSAHEEGSFMFGDGQPASTPLGKKPQFTGNESWESSIGSPFDKYDRKLEDLKIGGGGYDDESDIPTPSYPSGYGIPGQREDSSMSTSPSIRPPGDRSHSSRPMSTTPKATRGPGIIDLRNTPLNAKFPKPKTKPNPSGIRSQAPFGDDSDDDLMGGMSPLRTTNFGPLPPRVQAINAAVHHRTPQKAAPADAILSHVWSEMADNEYIDSPVLPELTMYNLNARASSSNTNNDSNASPLNPLRYGTGRETRKSMANTSFGSDKVTGPGHLGQSGQGDDSDDSLSSDDSGTVPPPGDYRSDVSYATNTPGATARYGDGGDFTTTMHAAGGQGVRDEEVFGGPSNPAARAGFGLMKQDEMYTYMGSKLDESRELEETPLKKPTAKR